MEYHIFDGHEEAEEFVSAFMRQDLSLSSDQTKEIAGLFVSRYAEEVRRKLPPGVNEALVPPMKWVIRDDDLQLMKSIFEALRAFASVGFFVAFDVSNPAKWAAATAIAALVIRLFNQARTKGKKLDEKDFSLLFALKKAPLGLRAEELLEKLRKADDTWTARMVMDHLQTLENIPVDDGTLRTFVVQEDGKWRTSGI